MIEQVQKLYDEIYQNLKTYLTTKSIYKPETYQDIPESKEFPIVIIDLLPYTSEYTTKKYTDEIYDYGLMVSIYAIQNGNIAKQTVADEITNHVENFFKTEYRMKIKLSKNVKNIDSNVYRNIVQATCLLDTKYKDKLVIYPN